MINEEHVIESSQPDDLPVGRLNGHPTVNTPSVDPRGFGLMERPKLLLVLTMLFWGGNAVAGRLAVDEISPAQLTCLRWVVSGAIIVPLCARPLVAAWGVLRGRLDYLGLMGAGGYTLYNILYYTAAHSTSAINMAIVTAAMPAMVLAGGRIAFGTPVRALQWVGAAVAFAGIALVASGGDPARLARLAVARGDLFVLIATVLYAVYSLALRFKPPLPSMVFFAAIVPAAALSGLVPVVAEIAAGTATWPTTQGWLVLLYVALFPSLLAQIFYLRAVELIGPGRAGLFSNLIPIFAALLAWLVLREAPGWHHLAALGLVLAGIGLSELASRRQ